MIHGMNTAQGRLCAGQCHFTKKTHNKATQKAPVQDSDTILQLSKIKSWHDSSSPSHVSLSYGSEWTPCKSWLCMERHIMRITAVSDSGRLTFLSFFLKWNRVSLLPEITHNLSSISTFFTVKSIGSCRETMNGSGLFIKQEQETFSSLW